METQELLDKGIGTEDTQTLKPAKVKIVAVHIKDKTKDGKEMQTPLAEIMCKHPNKDELISFSKVKLERDGQLKVVSTWVQLDSQNNIAKSSAIAQLMNYLSCKTLQELYNKEIDTIEQSSDNKYLCLKAY